MRRFCIVALVLLSAGPVVAKPAAPMPAAAGAAYLTVQSSLPLKEEAISGRRVETAKDGVTQILFADGTTLTLGKDSAATIDTFRFDRGSGEARLEATLERGAFRVMGGRTSKTPGGVRFATPYGALDVHHAGVEISLGGEGQPAHFDLLFGDSLSLVQGGTIAARARRSGYSILPGDSAAVRKTRPEWKKALSDQLSVGARRP